MAIVTVTIQDEVFIESRISVLKRILGHFGIFPVEWASVRHLKHVKEFLGRTVCAPSESLVKLTVVVRAEIIATACNERFGIAPVEISTRVGFADIRDAFVAGLHQLVVAIGSERVEESLAGIGGQFPSVLVIVAEPCHFLFGCLTIGEGRVGIEERACDKEQHARLKGHGSGLGHTSVPVLEFVFGDVPREIFVGDCVIEQVDDEVYRLLQRGSRGECGIAAGNGMVDDGQRSIVSEHMGIEHGDHHLGLCFQAGFLLLVHVGHPVDILIEQPGVADARPYTRCRELHLGPIGVDRGVILDGCVVETGVISIGKGRIADIVIV